MLHTMAYNFDPSRIPMDLRIMDIAESPCHPCLEQSRAKTVADVHRHICSAQEHVLVMVGSRTQCDDLQTIERVRSHYEWYANMHKLLDRPVIITCVTFTYLRAAAQKYWHEWSVGWRFFWGPEVEPILSLTDRQVWLPRVQALLCGTPNVVLQIAIRSAPGVDMESQAWWVNRLGFEKAVLTESPR